MGRQLKTKSIMSSIEPGLFEVMMAYIEKRDVSVSSYIRSIIISDLRNRGLLSSDLILKITEG